MKKSLVTVFTLVAALVALLPGVGIAGQNLNHNRTVLRG